MVRSREKSRLRWGQQMSDRFWISLLFGLFILVFVVASLTACGSNPCPQSMAATMQPVSMSLPMPAPVPAPKPPAPAPKPAPVYKAPAPAPKPAAPQPVAPKPVQRPYVPPRLPIYRPADPRMDRYSTSYNYRTVYVQHQTDHTPLLMLMAMNGMFSSPDHQECESK
jgi:hypothetical protein